jgi:hypothetical protein
LWHFHAGLSLLNVQHDTVVLMPAGMPRVDPDATAHRQQERSKHPRP